MNSFARAVSDESTGVGCLRYAWQCVLYPLRIKSEHLQKERVTCSSIKSAGNSYIFSKW